MISYSKWTQEEHDFLMRLVASGKRNKEIARILRRSCNAITSRLSDTRVRVVADAPIAQAPKVHVELWEVPDWYELGWRYVDRDETDFCIMEWRYSTPPRKPDALGFRPRRAA